MPLFFFLSGFFIKKAIDIESISVFFYKKFLSLILPFLSWIFITFLIEKIFNVKIMSGHWKSYLWFLRTLFICQLILFSLLKIYQKNSIICYVLVLLLIFFPKSSRYCFYTFFIFLGYIVSCKYEIIRKYREMLLCMSVILFIFFIPYFKGNYYQEWMNFVVVSGSRINIIFSVRSLLIIGYRIFIGTLGSIILFLLFMGLENVKNLLTDFFVNIGRNTLGIYILQTLILEKLLVNFINLQVIQVASSYKMLFIYNSICFVVAICAMFLSYFMVFILSKNSLLGFLLFGKKDKENAFKKNTIF